MGGAGGGKEPGQRAWAEKKEREVIRGAGGEGEADGGGVGCTGGFGD